MSKRRKEKRKTSSVGRFEYRGSEFEVFKKNVKINGTKWRKLKKK